MDDKGSLDNKNEKYAGSTYPVPPKAGELPTLEKKEKSKLTKKEKKRKITEEN